jgi:hypothetical protein
MLRESERALAQEAADRYDHVVSDRPEALHEALTEAAARVIQLRDAVIARAREEGDTAREDLAAVSAVLSLAYSAQFPISGLRWDRMEQTRDALRDLLKG